MSKPHKPYHATKKPIVYMTYYERQIEPPSTRVAYELLRSGCLDLMYREKLKPTEVLFDVMTLDIVRFMNVMPARLSMRLMDIAHEAARHNLPRRVLRRVPYLAYRLYIGADKSLSVFLRVLSATLVGLVGAARIPCYR